MNRTAKIKQIREFANKPPGPEQVFWMLENGTYYLYENTSSSWIVVPENYKPGKTHFLFCDADSDPQFPGKIFAAVGKETTRQHLDNCHCESGEIERRLNELGTVREFADLMIKTITT